MKLLNIIKNGIKEEFYAVPIGTIFSFISSDPPAGAFVLNGQIISNCRELFPEFWNYIIEGHSKNIIRVITNEQFTTELSSYGNCGAFVTDTSNGSIKLPSITTAFIQGAYNNIGFFTNPGLPNLSGDIYTTYATFRELGSNLLFHYSATSDANHKLSSPSFSNSAQAQNLTFDAHRMNSIYGNSNTVQPPAVHYPFCIQVFNAASKLSTVNASQISSELQGKAGINLENLTSSAKSLIQLYANELDYANTIEDQVGIGVVHTTTTGGVVVAYGTCTGSSTGVFYLQTAPDVSNSYNGFQNGGNLASGLSTSLHLIVPKGWQYVLGSNGQISVVKSKFIPFKN